MTTPTLPQNPVIAAPASVTVANTNQAVTITGLSLSQPGADPAEIYTVTLSDAYDSLADHGTGVSGTAKSLILTGTLSQINADLAIVTVSNGNGSADTITVNATDSHGRAATAQSIAVAVAGPPNIAAPSSVTVDALSTPVTGMVLSEPGAATGETFTVTLLDSNGLLSATGAGVTGAGTKTLTLTGSLAQVNAALATVTDTDTIAGSDTINVNATDSLGQTATIQKIGVSGVLKPVLTAPATLSVLSAVSSTVSGLSLAQSNEPANATFTVTFSDTNGLLTLSGPGVTGSGTATVKLSATLSELAIRLAALKISDSVVGADTLTITAKDTSGHTATQTIAISVAGAPTITAPAAISLAEGAASTVSGLQISETGSGVGEVFTVTLSDTTGLLAATGTGVSGSGGTSLTLTGSLAAVNAALATVTDQIGAADTLRIGVQDSFGQTTSAAVAIQPLVVTEAQLNAAILAADQASSASGPIVIALGANIQLGGPLQVFNLHPGVSVDLQGDGFTLDGQSSHHGLFVYSGAVTVENLTLANMTAAGGAGQTGAAGGGGGAGLGGGLFVANDTASGAAPGVVTLTNVNFAGDAAYGGGGGGTSFYFSGGQGGSLDGASLPNGFGSGGGGLNGSLASYGGVGSFGGGGGGGVDANARGAGAGGAGGFGGGGGAGGYYANPGAGGVGGGVGGSGSNGFGPNGGGGGLGAGGDIFVQTGASLTVIGGALGAGSVAGGGGGYDAKGGQAFGSGIALQGGQTITLGAAAGQTQTISGVIADPSAIGASGGGAVVVAGAGAVMLAAANSFSGGVTIDSGTLEIANGGAGSGAITFAGPAASLIVDDPTDFANALAGVVAGDRIDFAGLSATTVVDAGGGVWRLQRAGAVVESFNVSADPGVGFAIQADAAGTGTLLTAVTRPTVTAPGSVTLLQNTGAALGGLSVAETGAAAGTFTVSLSDAVGILNATGPGVVGAGTTSLTISGSLSDINARLATVRIQDAVAGADTLTVTAMDPSGQVGTKVIAVNAAGAPTISAAADLVVSPGQISPLTGLQITEPGAAPGETFTATLTDTAGILAASGAGVAGSGGAGLTITGSLADVNTALASVTFVGTASDTLSIAVQDSLGQTASTRTAILPGVSTEAQLNAAILAADQAAAGSGPITIDLRADLVLDSPLQVFNLAPGVSVDLRGNGFTLDGQSAQHGLFVYSGAVTVDDLTLADMTARGGDGGGGYFDNGGGGAGLGGGLFVANDTAAGAAPGVVTLDNVSFTGDAANGGRGGNRGGGGYYNGPGGSLDGGALPNGFGAGGAGYTGGPRPDPTAGFGGGGGGNGGAGGFGGGGGGLLFSGAAGLGGNAGVGGGFGGGGDGRSGGGGGGGLGAGGDIFVQTGASLTVIGGTLGAGAVSGGSGGSNAGYGQAFGSGIALQGGQTITLGAAAGQTQTISGVIADPSAIGASGGGVLVVTGAGTVKLAAANSFSGGVTIDSGTLEIANGGAGSGAITFAGPSANLIIDDPADFANALGGVVVGDQIDFAGLAATTVVDAGGGVWRLQRAGAVVESFTVSADPGVGFAIQADAAGTGTLLTAVTRPTLTGPDTLTIPQVGFAALDGLGVAEVGALASDALTVVLTDAIGLLSAAGPGVAGSGSTRLTLSGSLADIDAALATVMVKDTAAGSDSITITATDSKGQTGSRTVSVSAAGPPTIAVPATLTVGQGQATSVSGIGVNESGAVTGETFSVKLSDATGLLSATGPGVSGAGSNALTLSGSLADVTAALSTLSLSEGAAGADTLHVTATDSFGNVAAATDLAVKINGPPVIAAPTAAVIAQFNSLQSQSAIPGVSLSELGDTAGEIFTVTLSDPQGKLSLSFLSSEVITGTSSSLTIAGSLSQINYSLRTLLDRSSVAGTHPLQITVSDSLGNTSAPASIAVTVNAPPVATAPTSLVIGQGVATQIKGLGVSEVGDTTGETFTTYLSPSGNYSISTDYLQENLTQTNFDLANNVFLTENTPGTYALDFFVTESLGRAAGQNVSITVNGKPLIQAPSAATVGQGQVAAVSGISITESGNVTGETFTVTVGDTAGALGATGPGVVSAGAHSLTISGSLAQVNAALATLTVMEATTAADTIHVTLGDSLGGVALGADLAVSVTPRVPLIAAPAAAVLGKGKPGGISGVSLAEAGAVAGETFTVTLTDTVGLLSAKGAGVTGSGGKALTIKGSLAVVNAALATLADSAATAGGDTIQIAAVDSLGGTAQSAAVAVTINAPPVVTAPKSLTLAQGASTLVAGVSLAEAGVTSGETFTATITDSLGLLSAVGAGVSGANSHSLTISGDLDTVNAGLASLTDTSAAAGVDSVRIAVVDSLGLSASTVAIAVTTNGLPTLAAPATLVVGQGKTMAVAGLKLTETGVTTGETFTATVSSAGGVLTDAAAGVTGSGGSSLTITGALSVVNTALSQVKVTEGTLGADTIQVAAVDGFGVKAQGVSVAVTTVGLPVTAAPTSVVTTRNLATPIGGVSVSEAGMIAGETFTAIITDTTGVLTAAGSGVSGAGSQAVTITGDLAAVNAGLATLAYASSTAGAETVRIAVKDSVGDSAVAANIRLTVNGPPLIAAPSTLAVGQGKTVTVAGLKLSETGVTTGETFTATVSSTAGVLTDAAAGVTGSGGNSLTITGALSVVNTALSQVKVTEGTLGADTIQVAAVDGFGLDAQGVSVAVTTVGLPVIAAPARVVTTQSLATPISGVSVSEAGMIAGETFTATITDTTGLLTATGSGVSGSGSQAVTITGDLAAVNAGLATLAYASSTAGAETVRIAVKDSVGDSAVAASVRATVNGPPLIAAPSTLVVGKGKTATVAGLKITETGVTTSGLFTAVVSDTAGILTDAAAGVTGSGGHSLTITGTLAAVDTALAQVRMTQAVAGVDTIQVTAVDAFGVSAAGASVAVTVNGAPTLATPGAQAETAGVTAAVAGVSVSEAGETTGETFTVTVSDRLGSLAASGAGVAGSGGKTVTFTGALAQVNAALATLTETEAAAGADTITLSVRDSLGAASPVATIGVTTQAAAAPHAATVQTALFSQLMAASSGGPAATVGAVSPSPEASRLTLLATST